MGTKKILSLGILISVLTTPALALAKELSLPANAIEVSQGVFSLGKTYDAKIHSFVEGYAIVHKKSDAKGGNTPSNPRKPSSKCYAVMASGTKWKNTENWSLFPANSNLNDTFLLNKTSEDIGKWELAAQSDILGTGELGTGSPSDPYVLDDKNEVSFGNLDQNTIAVTVVWGIFSGPTFNRQLVAWDQIFNTYYQWSDSGEPGKMDYENISTHELGHSMGLADIYDGSCSDVTMYGYANYGETNKRSLEGADIKGINLLY